MNNIILEIDGVPYSGFTSATVGRSMVDVSGSFAFAISSLDNLSKFPIKVGRECRVLVNGRAAITGYVEKVSISYDATSHTITISGRDRVCDVIDSTMGNELSFSSAISLVDIAKKVLKTLEITNINVYSNTKLDIFDASEINNISAQLGETAYSFIEKYAQKRQVLVISDGDGNMLFARTPEASSALNTVLISSRDSQCTIVQANVDYDYTKRFYKYILSSQQNTTNNIINDLSDIDNLKVVSVVATQIDEAIRKTRTLNLMQNGDSVNTLNELQNKTTWESNFRRSRSFKYTAVVQGFSPINDQDIIWAPNLLVKVIDDYADVKGSLLLVNSVKFDYSIENGSTTTLELIDKDSYTVDVLQGIKYKNKRRTSKKGDNIIDDLTAFKGI